MTGIKILITVLVRVVVLFVVLMVWGGRRNAIQKPPGDPKKDDAKNFSDGRHPILDAFQGVLGPFTPKLKPSFLSPALTTFDLQKQPSYSIVSVAVGPARPRVARVADEL